jgi:hypothetical protein
MEAKTEEERFNNCIVGMGFAQSDVQAHEIPLEQPTSSEQYFVNSGVSRNERTLPSRILASPASRRFDELRMTAV